ncbi:hypothetical protein LY90DRAFT_518165 [Neocallimastix californiae]|uniref:Uncharacterized protein n=1 Tax=Neocallimastix californiae TaxID=1754190 RepID=A0A1Y1ZTK6_9FUNG|nr:hypothetical protein LY90DRAFT_518165 [Neocallimastix californiae]|eukprot:ORY13552.1 hypothetical protein LY90DRAFT_518165 [Neocallimastix californiae]
MNSRFKNYSFRKSYKKKIKKQLSSNDYRFRNYYLKNHILRTYLLMGLKALKNYPLMIIISGTILLGIKFIKELSSKEYRFRSYSLKICTLTIIVSGRNSHLGIILSELFSNELLFRNYSFRNYSFKNNPLMTIVLGNILSGIILSELNSFQNYLLMIVVTGTIVSGIIISGIIIL